MPNATSLRACSSVSAMCIGPTRRHLRRSTVVSNSRARSSMTPQWWARMSKPCCIVAPIESRPRPKRPAARGPDGDAEEDLGRRDDLVAGGVVLADPGFLEAELVEPLDQLEVALESERRVLAGRMERGHEDAEPHRPVEGHQSSRSGCSRTMRSYSGWKLSQPARWLPTWVAVRAAWSSSIFTGVPAASAISCTWQERSIVTNHHTASSTDWPTVSRPWLRRMAALFSPRAWAMRLASCRSSTTPV